MRKQIHTTHLQDPNTGRQCEETDTHDTPTRSTGRQCEETDTQDPNTGRQCEVQVASVRKQIHTTHLQDPNTGRQCEETDTHDTPTRPEYRSPV